MGVGVANAAVVLAATVEAPGTGEPLVMVVAGPPRPIQTYTEASKPEQSVLTAGCEYVSPRISQGISGIYTDIVGIKVRYTNTQSTKLARDL